MSDEELVDGRKFEAIIDGEVKEVTQMELNLFTEDTNENTK
ncbi:hypothetical protein RND61_14865 [Streptomyces sp. TRM76323]|uniref:Uncharacterized protein n=1 Tax=Streptomyces tamarix TaxID=3078565 RepID=A0ABU3QKP4_9ACTN|nr:hypothetical protein [Streptomyces tamarix]MDT9683345.1 hypothetical protein [Streptomyces tamarix]